MRNDGQRSGAGGATVPRSGRVGNGIIPNSFKTLSSCLRIVSSGASTVATTLRSAASAASAIVERDVDTNRDQVSWAGFDKLELERNVTRQVLLLAFSYGFQVWDVEVADNVRNLVSRHDGPVSFMQLLPKPLASNQYGDKFSESRPMLIICADASFSGDADVRKGLGSHGTVIGGHIPTVVWFYSLKSQSYVHLLRFRSVVHLVRCSSRVVVVLQSTQIHCLNPATLEREYAILVNQVPATGFGDVGVGPLAVGPRWMAYSGSQVAVTNSGRLIPQHLAPPSSFPSTVSNGNLDTFAHYAKESSKQLAAGIVTLGDIGYRKLSRYYSERLPEGRKGQLGTASAKVHGVANGNSPDEDNVGMVIVRDIVTKSVIAQFRAHKSPILSLCFDPSGILLVTASVQGHNINVFRIMPGLAGKCGTASGSSHVHLYRLQRGLTNAVIQDISFSSDSRWIVVSSSRGTSHLFAISPSGGSVNFQSAVETSTLQKNGSSSLGLQLLTEQDVCLNGPPVILSAVNRIRNGSNGWISTVSGAAAAATGLSNPLSGAIALTFCNGVYDDSSLLKKHYHLLVFSPAGSVTQYALHISPACDNRTTSLTDSCDSNLDDGAAIMVEAIQKWNVCQKKNCKDQGENIDMYGENNGSTDNNKVHPEGAQSDSDASSDLFSTTSKEKSSAEEKHHMYISEAELHMHKNQNPLWEMSKIRFQPFLTDSLDIDEECARWGEIAVERVPIHTLEAKSKGFVPVIDYLQSPRLQPGRTFVTNGGKSARFHLQGSDGRTDGAFTNERENVLDGHEMFGDANRDSVNTSNTPIEKKTRFESINTPGSSVHMDNEFAEGDD